MGSYVACGSLNAPRLGANADGGWQLPEGVQDWFALLAKFQGADVPFEEAWAELTRLGLVDDMCNWRDLVLGREASGVVH